MLTLIWSEIWEGFSKLIPKTSRLAGGDNKDGLEGGEGLGLVLSELLVFVEVLVIPSSNIPGHGVGWGRLGS